MSRNLIVALCLVVFTVVDCKSAQKPPVHTHTSSLDPFDDPERFVGETSQAVEAAIQKREQHELLAAARKERRD